MRSTLSRRRALPALAALLFVHFFSFYGAKILNLGRTHIQLVTAADRYVPFCQPFVVIYILAFVQWIGCYLYLFLRQPKVFQRTAWASVWGEAAAFVLFLLIPTAILRPEPEGAGVFARLLDFIYRSDTPVNCFPSLHCLQSWLCWRGLRLAPGHSPWLDWLHLIFTLLVCASTVLIRQHFLLDIPGGILLAEAGLLLTRLVRPAKG